MGCRILAGEADGTSTAAVLYCSTTMQAFGPVMGSLEEAELFIAWLPLEPRSYSRDELLFQYERFVDGNVCECGQIRDDDELERLAHAAVGHWCMCDINGDYCDFHQALQVEKDWEPEQDERFKCSKCAKKVTK